MTQSHYQKRIAKLDAMKPAVEATRAVLKEVISINRLTAEEKAALSPLELIQLRRKAQEEMFAARKAGLVR